MKTITRAFIALLMLAGTLFSVASPASAAVGNNDKAEVQDWYRETGVSNGGDTAGVNYWAGRFDSHNERCNYGSSQLNDTAWDMRSFLVGRNMDSKSNAQKVDWAYGVVLSRAPDSSGGAYWRNYLDNGGSWHTMVTNMTYSTEYLQTKVANPGFTWDYDIGPCSFNI